MAQEKIKMSVEKHGTKIRYRKMFRGKSWVSAVYPSDSRESKREAWQAFKTWRETVPVAPVIKPSDPDFKVREMVSSKVASLAVHADLTAGDDEAVVFKQLLKQLPSMAPNHLYQLAALVNGEYNGQRFSPVIDDRIRVAERMTQDDDPKKTAGVQGENFIQLYRTKAQIGEISIGRYSEIQSLINRIVAWFGPETSLQRISQETVKDFYQHLAGEIEEGMNRTSAYKTWTVFKSFIEHFCEENAPDLLPANLRSRKYSLSPNETGNPNPFTKNEIQILLENSNDRMKLFILMALNCGMYQGDISDLKASEVDWKKGRIIRPRSKIKKRKTAVKINWKLWPETFRLLQQFGAREGRVFSNANGTELVRSRIVNGKEKKVDNIRTAFQNRLIVPLIEKGKLPKDFKKTFKELRKTSANILEKSKEHAEFYEMYLDHSAVAKRHYLTGEPVPRFDKAIEWLGKQFGQ